MSYVYHLTSVYCQLLERKSSKDITSAHKEGFEDKPHLGEITFIICFLTGEQVWTLDTKRLLPLNVKLYKFYT